MWRTRALSLAVSALCMVWLAVWLSRRGLSYVNLDSLRQEPVRFSALLLVPAAVAVMGLVAAILPRLITVNLAVAIALIGLMGAGARVLAPEGPAVRGEPEALGDSRFYLPDSALGYVHAPNTVARHRRMVEGTAIYDVRYQTDRWGRRHTPTSPDSGRTSFVLWFGCSNVFGEGLSQTETLPYYTGRAAARYRPYNYGVSGWGPGNVLALASRGGLREEVPEQDGFAVVFLVPAAVGRVIGSSTVSTGWGRNFPRYVEGSRGEILRAGDFVHGRPYTTMGYFLWEKSGVSRYFGLELPLRYTADHYRLTAKVLKETNRLLARQLDLRGFVVVLSQAYNEGQREVMEEMRKALVREGVPYLDYTRLYDVDDVRYRLAESDYHNSARTNELIATRLAADFLHPR